MVTFDNFDRTKLRIGVGGEIWYGNRLYKNDRGNCRHVYKIGKTIVKFDFDDRDNDRYYRQTWSEWYRYNRISKRDLKYFPRTKAIFFKRRLIEIQEFVEGKKPVKSGPKLTKMIDRLSNKYNYSDTHWGNFLIVKRQPVVIDFGL